MSDTGLSARVTEAIRALHVELERWLCGESDDFSRIEGTLKRGFTFVSPRGDAVSATELLFHLRNAHGARQVRIRIENPVVVWSGNGIVLATYEEWHDHAEFTTARVTTVLFVEDESAPHGLAWRHAHETFKIPPPADD